VSTVSTLESIAPDGRKSDGSGRPSHKATNITQSDHKIGQAERWSSAGHKSGVLWFTGLSGAGKTTLALELERVLFHRGYRVYVLDGDNVRHGLSADLGFSAEDRTENIRRIGEVANLFSDAGVVVITAFISPYRADRDRVRAICGAQFHEIHISASLGECERRDPKGLYAKARAGQIPDFTGISAPYEPPLVPELVVETQDCTPEESVATLMRYVERVFALDPATP
jgi:bifunctional enzyme CysN/CysC